MLSTVRILVAFVFVVANLSGADAKELISTPPEVKGVTTVDADTVKRWLDSGEEMLILDPRKATDYEGGHLPNAINCPVGTETNIHEEEIATAVGALSKCATLTNMDKRKRIVAYCNGIP